MCELIHLLSWVYSERVAGMPLSLSRHKLTGPTVTASQVSESKVCHLSGLCASPRDTTHLPAPGGRWLEEEWPSAVI